MVGHPGNTNRQIIFVVDPYVMPKADYDLALPKGRFGNDRTSFTETETNQTSGLTAI